MGRARPMSLLLMSSPSSTICNRSAQAHINVSQVGPIPVLIDSAVCSTATLVKDLKTGAPLRGPVKVGVYEAKMNDAKEWAKMNDAKEVMSPMSLNRVPLFTDGTPLDKPSEYRFVVGGL
ncbi:hypothetical protein TorRG33x02_212330 [Trema orientale]|uniref:Uncharacterized protein n=1 Tax=Trema orientale TaxID=63057 RepID=A0A2P5EBK6_TREOI|nr:hypothetical protein TorRG33x02_212330 [Trema orientale]